MNLKENIENTGESQNKNEKYNAEIPSDKMVDIKVLGLYKNVYDRKDPLNPSAAISIMGIINVNDKEYFIPIRLTGIHKNTSTITNGIRRSLQMIGILYNVLGKEIPDIDGDWFTIVDTVVKDINEYMKDKKGGISLSMYIKSELYNGKYSYEVNGGKGILFSTNKDNVVINSEGNHGSKLDIIDTTDDLPF